MPRQPKFSFADALLQAVVANTNVVIPTSSQDDDNDVPVASLPSSDGDIDAVESPRLSRRGIEHEMQSHYIPTKGKTKIARKVTYGTSLSFNRVALKGVPGASPNRAYSSITQIYEDETGCLAIDDMVTEDQPHYTAVQRLLSSLERSAKNCDTTKGNYIV